MASVPQAAWVDALTMVLSYVPPGRREEAMNAALAVAIGHCYPPRRARRAKQPKHHLPALRADQLPPEGHR